VPSRSHDARGDPGQGVPEGTRLEEADGPDKFIFCRVVLFDALFLLRLAESPVWLLHGVKLASQSTVELVPAPLPEGDHGKEIEPSVELEKPVEDVLEYSSDSSIRSGSDVEITGASGPPATPVP
jgi:hypothetical protein